MRLEREVGREEQWELLGSLKQERKGWGLSLGYMPLIAVMAPWKGAQLTGLIHSFILSFSKHLWPPLLDTGPCVVWGSRGGPTVAWMVAVMERRDGEWRRHSHCYTNTSWQFTNWHPVPGPVVHEFGDWGPMISEVER